MKSITVIVWISIYASEIADGYWYIYIYYFTWVCILISMLIYRGKTCSSSTSVIHNITDCRCIHLCKRFQIKYCLKINCLYVCVVCVVYMCITVYSTATIMHMCPRIFSRMYIKWLHIEFVTYNFTYTYVFNHITPMQSNEAPREQGVTECEWLKIRDAILKRDNKRRVVEKTAG